MRGAGAALVLALRILTKEHAITTKELLLHARGLIAAGFWTKDNFAIDRTGKTVDYGGSKAGAFCALGAVRHIFYTKHVNNFDVMDDAQYALRTAVEQITHGAATHVPTFNDHPNTRLEDIVAVYDRAIAAQPS